MLSSKRLTITPQKAARYLKYLLAFYIVFCFIVAGLNFGLAKHVSLEKVRAINAVYEFFENELKTLLIILCSFLSLKAFRNSAKRRLYRGSLLMFSVSALLIHILLPLITGNREIYYTAMPLPWATTGLQLLTKESSFYIRHVPLWGLSGISAAVVFFIFMNIFVGLVTLLFGRRVQCAGLCLLNGFAAEIWAPVLPLFGKERKANSGTLRVLSILRIVMFALSVTLSIWWLLFISGIHLFVHQDFVAQLELIKYLSLELMAAMTFWVFWGGRGYCYYCPLGTFLSLLARIGRQRIRTDLNTCVACGLCTKSCSLSIDVAEFAKKREPVTSSLCVGCGHCVDACPTKTLRYETTFLNLIRRINMNVKDK